MNLINRIRTELVCLWVGTKTLGKVSKEINPDIFRTYQKPINWVNALAFLLVIFIIALAVSWLWFQLPVWWS